MTPMGSGKDKIMTDTEQLLRQAFSMYGDTLGDVENPMCDVCGGSIYVCGGSPGGMSILKRVSRIVKPVLWRK